jgi:hypothetical protein
VLHGQLDDSCCSTTTGAVLLVGLMQGAEVANYNPVDKARNTTLASLLVTQEEQDPAGERYERSQK